MDEYRTHTGALARSLVEAAMGGVATWQDAEVPGGWIAYLSLGEDEMPALRFRHWFTRCVAGPDGKDRCEATGYHTLEEAAQAFREEVSR